jgi:hypothetical protein
MAKPAFRAVSAKPHFIKGYGFLYEFDCLVGKSEFVQMTQDFVKELIPGSPSWIYNKSKGNRITSLDRSRSTGNTVESVKAKAIADHDNRGNQPAPPAQAPAPNKEAPKRPSAQDYLSRDDLSEKIRNQLQIWADEDKKASSDWYTNAKRFVQATVNNGKR